MTGTGLKIPLGIGFTDASMAVVRDDTILTVGSLALHDPSHSANPISALPASGGSVPNIAWKEAAAVLGTSSPTLASLPAIFAYGGNVGPAGTKGILERTPKGGLHGIISQAQSLTGGDGATLTLDTSVRSYLAANPTHAYYLGAWLRVTRLDPAPVSGTVSDVVSIGMSTSSSNFIAALMSSGGALPNTGQLGLDGITTALGVDLAAIGANTPTGTPNANGRVTWGAPAGGYNGNSSVYPTRNGHWLSFVLYRMYLEDLTVSGRTYAQVLALDNAAYAAAFASGGRYNGDTFTAVTALP